MMTDKKDTTPFEREQKEYERQKQSLLARAQGQYVVVHDDTLIGPYSSYGAAYNEGVKVFGSVPMLIKQVLPEDPVSFAPTVGTVRGNAVFNCQFSI
jgi:hypothetical protein